ncbi:hypothetical protein DICPUDRAFT_42108 [Dictyostelium purpureum]|uniref:Methyltransferase type 11 domain-containing protein n=1 Tax=Dictyostelium purpureum TaxID=5786 RepID=F1A1E6_DICPU|nr:uncharacterized protein DICPUDRAFT_42108 [Dictyostelium purpureum]EGC29989.1 hypothetical protein DICPUDRAFT_42108 [Dictyostelium purpureum]|eukprot:XP_003293492.1 hypothetical protein DICPUDRAFT_42108 [Dictyostelium purpureum]
MASSANQPLHPNAYAYHDKDVAFKYSNARPSYPIEAIKFIENELNLSKDSVIIDLAAGTGKFSSLIAQAGYKNITCVEPSGEFRDTCRDILENIKTEQKELDYKVLEGFSTSIPAQDNSVDVIFSVQAFHWFANAESIKEISRVLKPNGILFLMWNVFDNEANSEFQPLLSLFRGGNGQKSELMTSPFSQSYEWMNIFKDNESNEEFKKLINPVLEKKTFNYQHLTNTEKTIMAMQSISFIAVLPTEKRDALLEKMRAALNSLESTKDGKEFNIHYKTEVYITKKPSN